MQENDLRLAGYLGSKPTIRYLPSGTKVANTRLGQTFRYNKDGKPQEHTNWFNLAFYGDLAETAVKFEKGDNIYVHGSLDERRYIGSDKSPRRIYEVSVRKCHRISALSDDDKAG